MIETATRLIELRGRITGELDDRPQTTINLLVHPEWLAIRGAIFEALVAFPDAREAVVARLSSLDARALEAG